MINKKDVAKKAFYQYKPYIDMEVGEYIPSTQEYGVNEACCKGVKQGQVFWTIKLDDEGSWYDTPSQDSAEIISRLVKLRLVIL